MSISSTNAFQYQYGTTRSFSMAFEHLVKAARVQTIKYAFIAEIFSCIITSTISTQFTMIMRF